MAIHILSWNIRQGGGKRVYPIIQSIVDLKAHIAILSEFRNNRIGKQIREYLEKAGYVHQYVTQASAQQNSVLIASKMEGQPSYHRGFDENFPDNLIEVDYGSFGVIGMYLPHKKKHILFDLLIQQAGRDLPMIMAGDFNTGKNFIDQKKDSFWYTDKLQSLEDQGMVDAFRHLHGSVKEYSWYSHQGNGYRYDHTYVSELLLPLVKACHYIHDWREAGLSDHSPMLLTIAP